MALSKIKIPKPYIPSLSVRFLSCPQKIGITHHYRSTLQITSVTTTNESRNIFTTKQILSKVVPVGKVMLFEPWITIGKQATKFVVVRKGKRNNDQQYRNFSSSSKTQNDVADNLLNGFDGGFFTSGFAWLIGGLIFILFFFLNPITQVPAGHVGVIDLFGSVSERTLDPGLHLVNPLARVVKYSTKTQIVNGDTEVPSKEGLNVGLEVNLLYRIMPEKAKDMYKTVGKDYEDIVVVPQFKSAIRQVTSNYDAKALYTAETRAKMGSELVELLKTLVEHRGVIIEEAPLKRVVLPKRLTEAIEDKLSAEQQSQRMEFVLQKEKLEAERKAIEASGISRFQKIVAEGVSEQLLKWKGIEATEKLAESKNAKIVVIGGKDGLPLIFNADGKEMK